MVLHDKVSLLRVMMSFTVLCISGLFGFALNIGLFGLLRAEKTNYSQNLLILNYILLGCLPLVAFGEFGTRICTYLGIACPDVIIFSCKAILPFYGVNLISHIVYNRTFYRRIAR